LPFVSRRWIIRSEDLPLDRVGQTLRQSLMEGVGEGSTSLTQLDAGLSFIETRYVPARDFAIASRFDEGEPRLVLTLGLAGRSRFAGAAGENVDFREAYATLTAFNSSVGERQYEANRAVTQLRFSMTRPWLSRYFGDAALEPLFSGGRVRVLGFRPSSASTGLAARQILARDRAALLDPLFLHGQALSLLAEELEPLLQGRASVARFTARDRDMARQARAILEQELQAPPSVGDLARRVGTNTFKLKQLFHHFFGQTPYGLLLQFRMERAYQTLVSSRCPIHIVAAQVGYAHASNFSTAFTRYFGITPARVARNNASGLPPEGG